jgi:hypothetical protein
VKDDILVQSKGGHIDFYEILSVGFLLHCHSFVLAKENLDGAIELGKF